MEKEIQAAAKNGAMGCQIDGQLAHGKFEVEMLKHPTVWSKLGGSRRRIPCELLIRKSTGPVSPGP